MFSQTTIHPADEVSRGLLQEYRFGIFNTECKLRILQEPREALDAFVSDAFDWLRDFEAAFSRFQPGSLVSQINDRSGRGTLTETPELARLLDKARLAWQSSEGAVDITALPLYQLWHENQNASVPGEDAISKVRELVGISGLYREAGTVGLRAKGMAIDLGGIAKEYAIDRICERAQKAGLKGFLVAIGGDLRAGGRLTPRGGWSIGLEHPFDGKDRLGTIRLRSGAIATSGVGRRGRRSPDGRLLPHLIDPRTGRPASGPDSVTVFASCCFDAGVDATTACLQTDAQSALRWLNQRGRRAVVVDHNGGIFKTD